MSSKQYHFSTTVEVRWGDMDALGHVNNTAYFRYMEEVRVKWLQQMNICIDPTTAGPVLAHTSLDFMRPLVYPEQVSLALTAEPPGRSSVKLSYDFVLLNTDTQIACGRAVIVWVDYRTGRSVALPASVRAQLLALPRF